MFSNERNQMRQVFFTAWQKYLAKKPIEPLEAEVIEIIKLHPEYHALLANPEKYQHSDFDETNPFLHLSLHLALRDQIKTNRPQGIQLIYHTLLGQLKDPLQVEHKMMPCLQQILWEAQKLQTFPSEEAYLASLQSILNI